jgi:hypothetical protein
MAGMGPPEPHQAGEQAEGLRLEVVLDGFDFLFRGFGAQTDKLEQLGERSVAHFDVPGNGAAGGGEREAAVAFQRQFMVVNNLL